MSDQAVSCSSNKLFPLEKIVKIYVINILLVHLYHTIWLCFPIIMDYDGISFLGIIIQAQLLYLFAILLF